MLRVLKLITITALALVIIACVATPQQESTGEYLDSSVITGKVKAKLLDNLGSEGFAVKVKTYKDEVQLSGFVDNTEIKQRAGIIAASVEDVKRVRNDLIIK
ncbi:BON domain-containing protein [Legionella oakridgensis]|uniref:BON domain-containing protein n=1 Tax=Legionella oakridgensis TaxID=29423 RepID=UPI000564C967|nr:BON domain-containing protein [Legionella oakridgensis]